MDTSQNCHNPMITIENRGQAILTTDYWYTPHAHAGYLYLSWNAGAGRLLIPDSQIPYSAK